MSESATEHVIDKSTWEKGEWTDEPDHIAFEHRGVPCIIHRVEGHGGLCGYAAVPPGHPWHGLDMNDVNASVHGGITYSSRCEGAICHVPKPGEPGDVWWLGFDCAHGGDYSPAHSKYQGEMWRQGQWETYRNVAYVRGYCEQLADQIIEAAK